MSERAVHYVKAVYEIIEWATTSGGGEAPDYTSGSVSITMPSGFRRLVGLRPVCGAPMRAPSERRRWDDVTCKRCLRMAMDGRKKNRGYAARRRTTPDSEPNPAAPEED